jgi:4,5-dihydroxyphthalate decarboxylase
MTWKRLKESKFNGWSRRDFIRSTAVTAGAVGVGSALRASHKASAQGGSGTKRLTLKMGGYRYDRTEALADGRVSIDGCDIQFTEAGIGDLNTHVFSGPQELDVTEIGLHPYMLAFANDGFRDYSLLPIFPLRLFRHKSVFIRNDRGIKTPEDLRGKTIATPGYSSTSLTWIRGIFEEEYGVRQADVDWIVSSKDSSAKVSGKASRQEKVFPEGISISMGPEEKDESDLLESGEVDALFHAAEPRAYIEGHPKVARLFPDYRSVERAYYSKTGIFPIMHAVAVKNTTLRHNPWLVEAVFKAFSQAKQVAYAYLAKAAWAYVSLPWIGQEFAETRGHMGDNYYSYGLMPNRKTLEAFFRYSFQQGLSNRQLTIEEMFVPASLELSEELG